MNISEIIKELAKNGDQIYSLVCLVDVVDKDARTVDVSPINGSAPLLDVNLQANQGGSAGVVMFPKVGSHVVVTFLSQCTAVVVVCEEVESVEITCDSIVANDGKHGLVKVDKMTDWMNKVYNDLQSLITLLSTSAVAGNGAPLAIVFTPTTPVPVVSDFEDTKIKH